MMKTLIAVAIFACPLGAWAAAPVYRAVDIGSFSDTFFTIPTGLNSNGTVVGYTELRSNPGPTFIWTAKTGIQKIKSPGGGNPSLGFAYDINDRDQIVGYSPTGGPSGTGGRVIVDVDGHSTFFLHDTWAEERIYSIAQITNGGKVLGQSYYGDSNSTISYPWVWSKEHGLVDIVALGVDGYHVNQMNDKGQIVGSRYTCFSSVTAFLYDAASDTIRLLDPNKGDDCRSSSATAINYKGQVVGRGAVSYTSTTKPYIWTEAEGLKFLSGSLGADKGAATATDINNAGQVVGRFQRPKQSFRVSFFYWDEENQFHDLKNLLDPTDPMTAKVILQAYDGQNNQEFIPKINDRGQILVAGSLRGEKNIFEGPRHTFLLVPVKK
jgi:uncharacterized membrane protein